MASQRVRRGGKDPKNSSIKIRRRLDDKMEIAASHWGLQRNYLYEVLLHDRVDALIEYAAQDEPNKPREHLNTVLKNLFGIHWDVEQLAAQGKSGPKTSDSPEEDENVIPGDLRKYAADIEKAQQKRRKSS